MNLKKILSITGRSGLFRILGQGRNMIVVEDLQGGKRFPAHMRDKIVSLGDITMYTDSGDTPLNEIFECLRVKEEGKKVDVKGLIDNKQLSAKFAEIVPDYDRERVYDSDLKKFFTWYNILIDAGFTSFLDEDAKREEQEEDAAKAE